ncbi:MAG TPA: MraY family glycosyltransferase [Tepidisphaeraceae bacterium]|nr:MraY family glycosyltransferase [Tepidisphaeraceae bacterium]
MRDPRYTAAMVTFMFDSLLAQIPTKLFSADEVLANYVYVFYASFLVAFLFTPVMRAIALHYGIIDRPDLVRKMHSTPVAYLGGVAVFLGWLCGLGVSQFLVLHHWEPGWPTNHPLIPFSIVMGGLIIILLGLWDDVMGLRPWMKIAGQVFAAVFLLHEGIGTDAAKPLLLPLGVRLGQFLNPGSGQTFVPDWLVTVASGVLVVCLVVGCCNASNLMDGLDGLCGGVTAIIAAGFLLVATHLAMVGMGGGIYLNWDALRVILALALLGAVLGFIPYNFNPASIFMGDTGSMFLGFACAVMIILMAREQSKWFLAAMVMFALPILDTSLAFARRWVNGRPLFSPDRQHIHHQLMARGFTVKQTVLILYLLAIFFGLLGTVMLFLRTRYAVAFYLVIFGPLIVAAYKMGMIHERVESGEATTLGDQSAATFTPEIAPGTVMDIQPDRLPVLQEASDEVPGSIEQASLSV